MGTKMIIPDLNISLCFNNYNFILIEKLLLKGIIDFFKPILI
jgi:hypothetical protein